MVKNSKEGSGPGVGRGGSRPGAGRKPRTTPAGRSLLAQLATQVRWTQQDLVVALVAFYASHAPNLSPPEKKLYSQLCRHLPPPHEAASALRFQGFAVKTKIERSLEGRPAPHSDKLGVTLWGSGKYKSTKTGKVQVVLLGLNSDRTLHLICNEYHNTEYCFARFHSKNKCTAVVRRDRIQLDKVSACKIVEEGGCFVRGRDSVLSRVLLHPLSYENVSGMLKTALCEHGSESWFVDAGCGPNILGREHVKWPNTLAYDIIQGEDPTLIVQDFFTVSSLPHPCVLFSNPPFGTGGKKKGVKFIRHIFELQPEVVILVFARGIQGWRPPKEQYRMLYHAPLPTFCFVRPEKNGRQPCDVDADFWVFWRR